MGKIQIAATELITLSLCIYVSDLTDSLLFSLSLSGPSCKAMWALGDKVASSIVAQSADIPTLPWSGSGDALHPTRSVYSSTNCTVHEECTFNQNVIKTAIWSSAIFKSLKLPCFTAIQEEKKTENIHTKKLDSANVAEIVVATNRFIVAALDFLLCRCVWWCCRSESGLGGGGPETGPCNQRSSRGLHKGLRSGRRRWAGSKHI